MRWGIVCDNTINSEDRTIDQARDASGLFDALIEIIERLDGELTEANDEIDRLNKELREAKE